MNKDKKKIFLIASVIVPFVIYCVVYYAHVFKIAPYKYKEFKSFSIQWGSGDNLPNKYNSATGDYQFVNANDSLVHIKVILGDKSLKKLHFKASELGFWDWPANEKGDSTITRNGVKTPRQIIEFNYQRKSKIVVYDESFAGDPRLKEANRQMFKEIRTVLDSAAGSQKK